MTKGTEGPLEQRVGATLKNEDPLYKVMSLMSQKEITDVVMYFRNETKIAPPMRMASKRSIPQRWKDEDRWAIDVEIAAAQVKVTHHVTLVEGLDSKELFKVRLMLERIFDRKSGKVTCSLPRFELSYG